MLPSVEPVAQSQRTASTEEEEEETAGPSHRTETLDSLHLEAKHPVQVQAYLRTDSAERSVQDSLSEAEFLNALETVENEIGVVTNLQLGVSLCLSEDLVPPSTTCDIHPSLSACVSESVSEQPAFEVSSGLPSDSEESVIVPDIEFVQAY